MSELARIEAMQRWVHEATATRVEPWRFGTAVFTDDFPGRYDSNVVRVERPVGATTPAELAAEVDRVQASLGHREVLLADAGEGARLSPGLRELGYDIERQVVMVQRTPALAVPDTPTVREVDAHEVRPPLLAGLRAIDGMSDADATMLADFRVVSAERAGTRFFAAELDGELVAYCELSVHEGAADVEDVNTLAAYRNRGAGRAVVLAAIEAGRAAGADLVWLLADADSWPQQLYRKLGFEPLGGWWQFTKMAQQQAQIRQEPASAP
jgi:ribosomal protein S18 acetylase RimI-like enzyme